jgi:mRNA interferase RelE/StbE
MANYKVRFRRSVAKDLRSVPNADVTRILDRFREIAGEPRGPGSEKLSAQERYRIRQGSYRILYEVDDEERTVLVVKVAHRSEV